MRAGTYIFGYGLESWLHGTSGALGFTEAVLATGSMGVGIKTGPIRKVFNLYAQ